MLKKGRYTKCISEGQEIIIDACDEALGQKVFAWIDPIFRKYGVSEKGMITDATKVAVHELERAAASADIFTSLDSKFFSWYQIVNFAINHREWLSKDGCGTFFPLEIGDQLCLAILSFDHNGCLRADRREFDYPYTWGASCRHRVVELVAS